MKKDIVKTIVTSEESILSEMEMINVLGGDGGGNNSNTKNIQNSIALIIKNAHIKVEATNTHIMRHTCASLLYNNGVDLHSIAMILGNSEEVLKKTYVHFEEDTMMSIMEIIDFID